MEIESREHRSIFAVNLGLAANTLLAAIKTTMGIIGHSPALLADGINSTSDVVYYIVVRIFVGQAHKPADDEHPYGHRQLESIAALIVGAFVLTTAVAVFWDAVNRIYDLWEGASSPLTASPWALVVALFTVASKILLTSVTRQIGRQTSNPAVFALAYDHRNDIFAASAACIGISLSRLGYTWVDPLAGAIVAMVILRTGVEILRESSKDLMDTVPGNELREQVVRLLEGIPGVREIEEIQAHRFGPYLVINLTIGIDGSLLVAEGDRIATKIERLLHREMYLVQRVYVHYHPVQKKKRQQGGAESAKTADQI
jgi:cation diffusion facilitator family transporter